MEQQLEIIEVLSQPRIRRGGTGLIGRLCRAAEDLTGLPRGVIRQHGRARIIAFPRFAVMAVALEMGRAPTVIGRFFGMDHSSVLHGAKRAKSLAEDEEFAELLSLLRREACR